MESNAPQDYICPVCSALKGIDNEVTWIKKTDVVYRDEWVQANISPKFIQGNEGHVIVVPTKHYESIYDLPSEYGYKIFDMAQKVALALKKIRKCDGVTLVQNNEPAGDQHAFHYHLHVIPRFKNDNFHESLWKTELSRREDRIEYATALRRHFLVNRYFLSTQRLGFRTWHEDDFEIAKTLWGDYEVTKLIDVRGKLSDEQVKEKLTTELERKNMYGAQYWPIFLLETGENVGCCGLRPRDAAQGIFEIGFHIRPKFWRQGFAFEAAQAVTKHAFSQLKVQRLFAGHNPQNEASKALLEKLGFKYTHDELYEPTGLQHPSYILTKEDFMRHNSVSR